VRAVDMARAYGASRDQGRPLSFTVRSHGHDVDPALWGGQLLET
jgi:hypothetical protein